MTVPRSSTIATDTTLTSATFVTTTDAAGKTVTTAPAVLTSQIVTTSNGQVITITQIVHNPTGALDSGNSSTGSTNAFFNNKGAVAGVFVVVGLVIFGMLLALGLLCFRRRRRQRLDREVTAAAVAASANSGRLALDEGDDVPSTGHNTTAESYPSTPGHNTMQQYSNYGASYANAGGYDPYAQQMAQGGGPGGMYHGDYLTAGAAGGAAAGAGAAAAGAAGAGGYDQLQQGHQGYYFDPRDAQQYGDNQPYSDNAASPYGHPQQQQHYNNGQYPDPYGDPYAGYTDQPRYTDHDGTGSIDTPPERENPLHVANPSRQY